MPTPPLWKIPYQRNPFFTGREDALAQLHRALQTDSTVALSHPQGISGLGGIGKTQTALEYAYRYRTEYDAVFWVRADSITALTSSLVELAHVLELSERYEQDQEMIVQAVLRWFRLHRDWLLIYDNIDDLSIAEPFLPKAGPGHLLFTTRSHAFGELAQRLDIQKMETEIGALLLLRRANLIAIQASLDMAKPDDPSIARAISQELDGLPLAIDQAGAYIKEAPCPLPDYLTRYQTRHSDLLQVRGSFDQGYPASVATTWSLSFEKVGQANPASTELLDFCAFLAADAIPEEMITRGALYLTPLLQMVAAHPLQFDSVLVALLAYSLIGRNEDGMLNMHRLVQVMLKDAMNERMQDAWIHRVVCVINTVFPQVEFTAWQQCELYLPHALACAVPIRQKNFKLIEAAELFHRVGWYLIDRARYSEAEPLYQQALAIREDRLGEHSDTALSLNNLGLLYWYEGKYQQAEPLYQQALTINEKILGLDDLEVATNLTNLGLLYKDLGKYAEAELLHQRALAIREKQLGAEHLETAISFSHLAGLYHDQARYAEAEPLYQRALAIREKQLGIEDPDIANSLNNLGLLFKDLGKYAEAQPLYQRALAIREKQLGVEHPDTARSLNNLGSLYRAQMKYTEAEPLYQRALAIREKQLGVEHPDIAQSLNNLGSFYYEQGKYEQAELLMRRALTIREQAPGPDHPDTANSLYWLAVLYQQQEQHSKAEQLYRRALMICKHALGSQHPHTNIVRSKYASLLRKMGRGEDAKNLEEHP